MGSCFVRLVLGLDLPLLLGVSDRQAAWRGNATRGPLSVGALVVRSGLPSDGTGAEPFPEGIVVIHGRRIAAVGAHPPP